MGAGSTLSLSNTTVRNSAAGGSFAEGRGGGLFNRGMLALNGVTLTGNALSGNRTSLSTGGASGGGLYNELGATATLTGGAITDNSACQTVDCSTGASFSRFRGGGGVFNRGSLTATATRFSRNTTEMNGGGILSSEGSVTLQNATVDGNSATGGTGGLTSYETLNLTGVTLNGNSGRSSGGALEATGTATLTNVTISGNSGEFASAIALTSGSMTLTNGTVVGNINRGVAGTFVAGAVLTLGTITVKNTILANAATSGANCNASAEVAAIARLPVSAGNNLTDDASCGFTAAGDLQNTDPRLGPLQSNGGPTQTHALLADSPAVDAGTNTGCFPHEPARRGAPHRRHGPRHGPLRHWRVRVSAPTFRRDAHADANPDAYPDPHPDADGDADRDADRDEPHRPPSRRAGAAERADRPTLRERRGPELHGKRRRARQRHRDRQHGVDSGSDGPARRRAGHSPHRGHFDDRRPAGLPLRARHRRRGDGKLHRDQRGERAARLDRDCDIRAGCHGGRHDHGAGWWHRGRGTGCRPCTAAPATGTTALAAASPAAARPPRSTVRRRAARGAGDS